MDEIKQWLADGGHYSLGLMLFTKHSHNRNLCNYLSRKNDPEKLRYELGKLANIVVAPTPQAPANADDTTPMSAQPVANIDNLPDTVKPYADAAMQAYHKARKAHTYLKDATTDKKRAALRSELLRYIDENKRNWAIVNDFRVHSILPTQTEAPTANQLLSTASSLSRTLSSLEKATDEIKASELKDKIVGYVAILKAAGREFNQKTTERLRALKLID